MLQLSMINAKSEAFFFIFTVIENKSGPFGVVNNLGKN